MVTSEINRVKLTKSIKQVPKFQKEPWGRTSLSLTAVPLYQNLRGTALSWYYKYLKKSNDDDYNVKRASETTAYWEWKIP